MVYQQKYGEEMRSPLSPIVANLFMEYFEEKNPLFLSSSTKVMGKICG
jgi:hypothetical protein